MANKKGESGVKFLNGLQPQYDLTYNDVFLVPNRSDISSRMDVNLITPDELGTTIPVVVANMMSVAGKRMAETVARRGGVVVLPQDIDMQDMKEYVEKHKKKHSRFDTPITVTEDDKIYFALKLIRKRAHGAALVVDAGGMPVGVFTETDAKGIDSFSRVGDVMSRNITSLDAGMTPEEMYEKLVDAHITFAPVVENGKLAGVMTKKSIIRSTMYSPAVDAENRLMLAAAIGVNGDPAKNAQQLLEYGVDVLVVDTAHGHQGKMLEALEAVRKVAKDTKIVAGNVATAEATKDLINAGADVVKVGIGPGAACTTRMVTGVGRPQFSAVLECAEAAESLGKHVMADGGTKYPRDFALALAAGASTVMVGSWFAQTLESTADLKIDVDGRMYKEHFGMASRRAVSNRNQAKREMELAYKEYFKEGISDAKMYLDPTHPGVEDIIDTITAGVRSSMTYAGAHSIDEFHEKAIVGLQAAAGFAEGMAHKSNWAA